MQKMRSIKQTIVFEIQVTNYKESSLCHAQWLTSINSALGKQCQEYSESRANPSLAGRLLPSLSQKKKKMLNEW